MAGCDLHNGASELSLTLGREFEPGSNAREEAEGECKPGFYFGAARVGKDPAGSHQCQRAAKFFHR